MFCEDTPSVFCFAKSTSLSEGGKWWCIANLEQHDKSEFIKLALFYDMKLVLDL